MLTLRLVHEPLTEKICPGCKRLLRRWAFGEKTHKATGYKQIGYYCKECSAKRLKEWRAKKRAHVNQQAAAYREKDRELIRNREETYRNENREALREYSRTWWRTHKGKGKRYQSPDKKKEAG